MKFRTSVIALLISFSSGVQAGEKALSSDRTWFASVGTGFSWTMKPGIRNPNLNTWDASNEGYDASLGDRGFYTFAIGKTVHDYVDLSVNYIAHETFKYQKNQTGRSDIPNFLGNVRTRFFSLNSRALLFNVAFHPDQSWYDFMGFSLVPYAGVGIGLAQHQMNHFYTVSYGVFGLPIGSTSYVGKPSSRADLAWQSTLGVNFRHGHRPLSVNMGYQYFDGGHFKGPYSVYGFSTSSVHTTPWIGRLRANQLFLELKYNV